MRWLILVFCILLWTMCVGVVFSMRELALWAKRDRERAEEEAKGGIYE